MGEDTNVNHRIKELLDLLNISNSHFAETIGVQKSSISHLTAGRNKPSLEFIQKIKRAYPLLSLEWLVLGSGNPFIHRDSTKENSIDLVKKTDKDSSPTLFSRENTEPKELRKENTALSAPVKKEIKKIVWFYTDGSFEEFDQKA